MKTLLLAVFLLGGLAAPANAHDEESAEASEPARAGYVLKPGEGEAIGSNRLIKASRKSGTRGGVMVLDQIPPKYTTGVHIHTRGDEFFYIISGAGVATLGEEEIPVGPGDVVFAPENALHAISVSGEAPMEILAFMDEPGLAELFREAHAFVSQGNGFTLEDCNALGAKHNMICVTLGGRRP